MNRPWARDRVLRRPVLGALAWGVVAITACGEPPAPIPADQSMPIGPRPAPERTGPFRNPRTDRPGPREPATLEPGQVAGLLSRAAADTAAGRTLEAAVALRECANREPPHVQCEGELAIALAEQPAYRAEALYYLEQATALDDPSAPAEFWVRLGSAAVAMRRNAEAAIPWRRAIDRGDDSAEAWARLSRALQSDANRTAEALDALVQACSRDPARTDWAVERSVLLAQLGRNSEAVTLLRDVLARDRGKDPDRDARLEARIAELATAPAH
jgi:tetratricopeptide (TPR) repeat protein